MGDTGHLPREQGSMYQVTQHALGRFRERTYYFACPTDLDSSSKIPRNMPIPVLEAA